MKSEKSSHGSDLQADVVVIGGGGSGLPAAVSAIEAGARKVIVLENRKILGGTGRMPCGMFAVESHVQKRQGIHDTADELYKMHMERANWMCEARLVRDWYKKSKDIVGWLEEKGVEFSDVIAFSGTTKVYHSSPDSRMGNAVMNVMVKECQDKGVQLLTQTRVQKLITDKEGKVTGVLATQGDKEIKVAAKSVIIATGSISANKELLKKYWPDVSFDDMVIMANTPNSTGDGLLMAQEVGAAQDALMSVLWIGPHNYPNSVHVGLVARRPQMVYVNKYGMRYVDESLWVAHDYGWYTGTALERQPGKICYALFDEKARQDMFVRNRKNICYIEELSGQVASRQQSSGDQMAHYKESIAGEVVGFMAGEYNPLAWMDTLDNDFQREQKAGRVKITDSLEEIAQWMGSDPTVLKKSIDEYNVFCEKGYDADFLKPKEYLLPLSTPPYYAILAHEGADTFIGGIRISHQMEVLDKELKPIGGLYAAGVATSGWLGPLYSFGGSEFGFSLFSGYTAGRTAAAYATTGK